MKNKAILFGCIVGFGIAATTWAETQFIDSSTPEEEIVKSLPQPESKGWGEQEVQNKIQDKGFDEIVNDMSLSELAEKPKIAMKVHFDTDSAVIRSDDSAILQKVAIAFQKKELSEAKIVIAGHTDSDGGNTYNMGLSYNRAESVKRFLISQGVSGNALAVKAFGEENPIASNGDSEGKSKNRRVEFIRIQ